MIEQDFKTFIEMCYPSEHAKMNDSKYQQLRRAFLGGALVTFSRVVAATNKEPMEEAEKAMKAVENDIRGEVAKLVGVAENSKNN